MLHCVFVPSMRMRDKLEQKYKKDKPTSNCVSYSDITIAATRDKTFFVSIYLESISIDNGVGIRSGSFPRGIIWTLISCAH